MKLCRQQSVMGVVLSRNMGKTINVMFHSFVPWLTQGCHRSVIQCKLPSMHNDGNLFVSRVKVQLTLHCLFHRTQDNPGSRSQHMEWANNQLAC
jgi:hypothetical protein